MIGWLLRVVRIAAALAAVVTAVACGGESRNPAAPSSPGCQGGGSFTTSGFSGPTVSGFEVDRRNLADGLGVTIRVGERVRIPISVGRPAVTRSCGPPPVFTYMLWSWNYTPPPTGRNPNSDTMPLIPRTAPIDVTMAACSCRLFGDPYWAAPTTGGTSHWSSAHGSMVNKSWSWRFRGYHRARRRFLLRGSSGRPTRPRILLTTTASSSCTC